MESQYFRISINFKGKTCFVWVPVRVGAYRHIDTDLLATPTQLLPPTPTGTFLLVCQYQRWHVCNHWQGHMKFNFEQLMPPDSSVNRKVNSESKTTFWQILNTRNSAKALWPQSMQIADLNSTIRTSCQSRCLNNYDNFRCHFLILPGSSRCKTFDSTVFV